MLKGLKRTSSAIALVCALTISTALAADPLAQYDLPAGELEAALKALASASDVELVYQPEQVQGVRTEGVKGEHSAREAVAILLKGTKLEVRTDASGAMVIAPKGKIEKAGARVDQEREFRLAQADTRNSESPTVKPADESDAAEDNRVELEEVVVTGTHIRGRAPAGSELLVIDRKEIERGGYLSAGDIVRALPQNFAGGVNSDTVLPGLAGTGDIAASTNLVGSTALNLRGVGVGGTLTLLNGRRMAPSGTTGAYVDVSSIPVNAIERVEVLPDGASAVYGSDAVGGVVNYILRKDFDGVETRLRGGSVTDGNLSEWQASQLFGKHWTGGAGLLSLDYRHQTPLQGRERREYESDLRRFGGDNFSSNRCDPGTLIVAGQTYALPPMGGSASDLVAGTVNECAVYADFDVYPRETARNVFATVQQELTDTLSVAADAFYSNRDVEQDTPNGVTSLTVPAANAFFVDPTGTAASVDVLLALSRQLGRTRTISDIDVLSGSVSLTALLPAAWRATLGSAYTSSKLASSNSSPIRPPWPRRWQTPHPLQHSTPSASDRPPRKRLSTA